MANICLYKILVKGTKASCYKLIDMMPLYSSEKEIIREQGSDEDYELLFTGDCKWSVDAYTSNKLKLIPYTEEEINSIEDGYGWEIPLSGKSLVLNCEIFCNSKDIDDSCYAVYEHYNKGKRIYDECPKELHIKRGRDYDVGGMIFTENGFESLTEYYERIRNDGSKENDPDKYAKVKFEDGRAYWYDNKVKGEINDLVFVNGAKEDKIGKIIELSSNSAVSQDVIEIVGHVGPFYPEIFEEIWLSYKPKARKEYLKLKGIEETVTKNKFITIIENRWNEYCQENNNWDDFVKQYK